MEKKRIKISKIIINLVLILLCVACLIPIILVLSASLSVGTDIEEYGYRLIPKRISFDGYANIFRHPMTVINAYRVTFQNTVIGSTLGVFLCALYAYPISRTDFKYRGQFSFYLTFTMLFSGGLIPTYILFTQYLHLRDSLAAPILNLIVNVWYIYMLRLFFQSIPTSLIEAAKLDGAGEGSIFFRIMLPLSKTGLVTILLFYVLSYWGEWNGTMLYITSEEKYSLQYLLSKMTSYIDFITKNIENLPDGVDLKSIPKEPTRMAMWLIVAGPMLFIFPFFQKYFVEGITVGAVKG